MKQLFVALLTLTSTALAVTTLASTAAAAPAPTSAAVAASRQLPASELVTQVLKQHTVLQGTNSKGALGSDEFALRLGRRGVVRANLRSNQAGVVDGGASAFPEMFHMNMNVTTPAGTSQTIRLNQIGKPKESVKNIRIVNYEAPMNTQYGKMKLVATLGQQKQGDVWATRSAYVHFISK